MSKFDWLLLITFLIAIVIGGFIVPFNVLYKVMIFNGFWSLKTFIAAIVCVGCNYSVISFLKSNWN